jgi:L-ascorbate metabolism protein UlaG (beta-lactamase superfamily)
VSVADEKHTLRRPEHSARQRLTWLGHSTVLIEADGVRFLTDPVLRARVLHLRRVAASAWHDNRNVDAVLISHLHYDHLDFASLSGLRKSLFVVPRGAGSLMRRRGFRHVVELEPGGEEQVNGVTVRATHAEHDSSRGPFGVESVALGYLVSGSVRTYFAGDTDLFGGMGVIADELDVALLPVAGWGPKLPPGHLNPRSAAAALSLLHPRIAVPIHWGTYRRVGLSRDPAVLREPAESFARLAAELVPDVDVVVLPIDGVLDIEPRTTAHRAEDTS